MVSPTIRNIKVTKMPVDGGAGLNLISPSVIKKLQIPDEDLQETGTFQGVNPGRTKPNGQITLPVIFGDPINYRTEKIVFDVVKLPLPCKAFWVILPWPSSWQHLIMLATH